MDSLTVRIVSSSEEAHSLIRGQEIDVAVFKGRKQNLTYISVHTLTLRKGGGERGCYVDNEILERIEKLPGCRAVSVHNSKGPPGLPIETFEIAQTPEFVCGALASA